MTIAICKDPLRGFWGLFFVAKETVFLFNKQISEWHFGMFEFGVPFFKEALNTKKFICHYWEVGYCCPQMRDICIRPGNFFLKGSFWLEVGKGLVVNTRWFGWNMAMLRFFVFVIRLGDPVIRRKYMVQNANGLGSPIGCVNFYPYNPLPNLLRFGMGWTLKTYLKSTKIPAGGMKFLDCWWLVIFQSWFEICRTCDSIFDRIHGTGRFTYGNEWILMINVGKYTSPMELMGHVYKFILCN